VLSMDAHTGWRAVSRVEGAIQRTESDTFTLFRSVGALDACCRPRHPYGM